LLINCVSKNPSWFKGQGNIDFKRLLQVRKLRWHPDTSVLLMTIQASTKN